MHDLPYITKLLNKNKWAKIYKLIKENKIDPNISINNTNTIAHLAAINNNHDIILFLLKEDPLILSMSGADGNSSIHLLATYGHTELLTKTLEHHPDYLNLINNAGDTVINILYQNYDMIHWILDNVKPTNIIKDNQAGQNIINKNITKSSDINSIGYRIIKLLCDTHLDEIKQHPGSFACMAAELDNLPILQLLINNKYDINRKDQQYLTPFIYAVQNNNLETAKIIIDAGCDINYSGPEGDQNSMIYSIIHKNINMIELLIENKFNMAIYDRNLQIPVHFALSPQYAMPVSCIYKILYYSDINKKNIYAITPFHLLCKYHDLTAYSEILKNKHASVDIFVRDSNNKRPIDYINPANIHKLIDIIVENYANYIDNKCCLPNDTESGLHSKECKAALQKYIFETERSVPIKRDLKTVGDKLKMINSVAGNVATNVIQGSFNSDVYHNMVYTVILLEKYKNLGIPFQYYFHDKYQNDKIVLNDKYCAYVDKSDRIIWEIVNIYVNFFYEIQPYLIIWHTRDANYIHPKLKLYIDKCLKSKKIRFIMFKLTLIVNENGTHANILIYDKKTNTLERFEPYGIIPYIASDDLDKFIEAELCPLISGDVKYYKPIDLFDGVGMQVISNDDKQMVKKLGDPAGFCLAWTFWYLEMRINNPGIGQKELIKLCEDTILEDGLTSDIDKDKIYIQFIRNYAHTLDVEKNKFMKSIGIVDTNVYNLVYNREDTDRLIRGLVERFETIVGDRY